MSFQGFAGPGANPSPMLGAVARGMVSTRTGGGLPDDVIAAAREERVAPQAPATHHAVAAVGPDPLNRLCRLAAR